MFLFFVCPFFLPDEMSTCTFILFPSTCLLRPGSEGGSDLRLRDDVRSGRERTCVAMVCPYEH